MFLRFPPIDGTTALRTVATGDRARLLLPIEGREAEGYDIRMHKTLGVWKTTILGGVFFLLPFAVLVFLVGQVAAIIVPIAKQLQPFLPEALSFGVVSGATGAATVLVILACYLAGLAAQRSFAARFSVTIEKNLLLLFPRYAILKNRMASNLGGPAGTATMTPVLVRFDDATRIGFETERDAEGLVTVYLPSAPDPWSGHVVHMAAERVTPLATDFNAVATMCETLGREASRVIAGSASTPPLCPPLPSCENATGDEMR